MNEYMNADEMNEVPKLQEYVLEDDYPIHRGFIYVTDGQVYYANWHGITVAELKAKEGFQEVRSCDFKGRGLFKDPEKQTARQKITLIIEFLAGAIPKTQTKEFSWPEFYRICGPGKMTNEERKELAKQAASQRLIITYAKKVTVWHLG